MNIFSIFVVFSLSLGVYSFARLYTFFVVQWKEEFYTDIERVHSFHAELFRDLRNTLARHPMQQFFPFLYYLLVPLFLFSVLKGETISWIVVLLLIIISVPIGIHYKRNSNSLKDI